METIDQIDRMVSNIPVNGSIRPWNYAKRDYLVFRGSKMKARQFVKIVANSLPEITNTDTNKTVDHLANIQLAYRKCSLNGVSIYERYIHDLMKSTTFIHHVDRLSVRTKNVLIRAFELDSIDQLTLDLFKSKELDLVLGTRGAGKKTKEEILELSTENP